MFLTRRKIAAAAIVAIGLGVLCVSIWPGSASMEGVAVSILRVEQPSAASTNFTIVGRITNGSSHQICFVIMSTSIDTKDGGQRFHSWGNAGGVEVRLVPHGVSEFKHSFSTNWTMNRAMNWAVLRAGVEAYEPSLASRLPWGIRALFPISCAKTRMIWSPLVTNFSAANP